MSIKEQTDLLIDNIQLYTDECLEYNLKSFEYINRLKESGNYDDVLLMLNNELRKRKLNKLNEKTI